jgi:hypothetical protein
VEDGHKIVASVIVIHQTGIAALNYENNIIVLFCTDGIKGCWVNIIAIFPRHK